jgi:hypothetical protein
LHQPSEAGQPPHFFALDVLQCFPVELQEVEASRVQETTQSLANEREQRRGLQRVRDRLREIVEGLLQIVLLAEEAPLEESLDAIASRSEGGGDDQRRDDRHQLTVLPGKVQHGVADQDHDHEIGTDHQAREHRVDQRPADEHLDVHQPVARDGVPEAHRDQYHRNRSEQGQIVAAEQLAQGDVEDQEGQGAQHRSQRQELHALPESGVPAAHVDRDQARQAAVK